MKWVKRIAGIIAGIFIFTFIVCVLNYMYVGGTDEEERILWHSFYEDEGKIDNLYLGSSHVYFDIDPYQLDRLNGQYNFNLSTPGQLMNGSYYLLREADRCNRLSHVYVELYYYYNVYNVKDNFDGDRESIEKYLSFNWENTDYMRLSFNKLQYMTTMADIEKYPDIFLGFTRYREHIDDWNYVREIMKRKRSSEYLNYQYRINYDDDENIYDEYFPKGRVYTSKELSPEQRRIMQDWILEGNPMAETSELYLRKVITYCQEKDIPITLFISPIYELLLISTEHYDSYLEQVRGIAAEYGLDVYDFNLVGGEYLPIQEPVYFRDAGHLNSKGAELFTDFFYKVVSGDTEENRKYFYDSYEEKLAHAEPEVYGIYCRDEPEEDGEVQYRSMYLASNRAEGMEYRIVMTPKSDKEQYLIQDFSENRAFRADISERGTCTITYRMQDAPDVWKTIEITY